MKFCFQHVFQVDITQKVLFQTLVYSVLLASHDQVYEDLGS